MIETVDFILVADATRARYLRRKLAEDGTKVNIHVGVFKSLVSLVCDSYLISTIESDWDEKYQSAISSGSYFWSKSLKVAPEETSRIIKDTLFELITSYPITKDINICDFNKLDERPEKHLNDLLALYKVLDEKLDDDYEILRSAVLSNQEMIVRNINLHFDYSVTNLSLWENKLVEKLMESDNYNSSNLSDELLSLVANKHEDYKSINALQDNLYSKSDDVFDYDDSVQIISVRDFQEEAEVASGMIQEMLKINPDLSLNDIGLLLPSDFEYSLVLKNTLDKAGILSSGLRTDIWKKDLGREALYHFIYCRQSPSPAMAMSVCLSSVLMPWSHEEGAVLAQSIMNGDYRLKPLLGFSSKAKSMLKLISGSDDDANKLLKSISSFTSLLDGHEQYNEHIKNTQLCAELICKKLEGESDVSWKSISRMALPKYINTSDEVNFNQEGLTIWYEGHSPWRSVRKLLILGFSEGHYPQSVRHSAVYSPDDMKQINTECGFSLLLPEDISKQRRQVFKQQLTYVTDSITFLIPQRNILGERISPSDSLVFISKLFNSPSNLILELEIASDLEKIHYLATAETEVPISLRDIDLIDLSFDSDLLSLRKDAEGNNKAESPSSLEKLMVSPLAWLMSRLKVEAQEWAPEEPNVLILGTLAHHVFELLFSPGQDLPDDVTIADKVKEHLDAGILKYAPYLRSNQWQVERANLLNGTLKAAREWKSILLSLDAEVIGSEQWLKGTFSDISILGQADSIIKLNNDQVLVVDYKRSSSGSRRPRMEKSYDSQAYLYIEMLKSGAAIDIEDIDIQKCIKTNKPGIVYYMMNDQTALTDYSDETSNSIPTWNYILDDVSTNAIDLIRIRLKEIKSGNVYLNKSTDEMFFDKKAGIKPYALDDSPLISLFTREDLEAAE